MDVNGEVKFLWKVKKKNFFFWGGGSGRGGPIRSGVGLVARFGVGG